MIWLTNQNLLPSQVCQQQQQIPLSASRATSLRTATHRYVKRPFDQDELYDLVADPKESHNLIDDPSYRSVLAELKERMIEWYINTSDTVPILQDPRGFSPEHPLRVSH